MRPGGRQERGLGRAIESSSQVKQIEAVRPVFDLRPLASRNRRKEVNIVTNVLAENKVRGGDGTSTISPEDVERLFADSYREIEILPDGRIREVAKNGDGSEETVTRTIKTERTWY